MSAAGLIDNKQRVGALLLLAFSVAYLRLAMSIPVDPTGSHEVFSARTLPLGLSAATILLSLLQLVLPAAGDEKISDAARGLSWRPAVLLVVLMAAYALLFEVLGFVLASVLFLQAGFVILGERRWLRSLAVSTGLVVFMWFVLSRVFGLYLDSGAIFRVLGD